MANHKVNGATARRKLLTAIRLREVLHYDPSTGLFYWRHRAGEFNPYNGKLAGCWKPPDRLTIRVDRVTYYAHRLAWLYVHGKWPRGMIEPKNGRGTDNRIANLRLANKFTIKWRPRRNVKNKSGHKGVFYVGPHRSPWRAMITHKNVAHYLGVFSTREAARDAYQAAALRLRGKRHAPN